MLPSPAAPVSAGNLCQFPGHVDSKTQEGPQISVVMGPPGVPSAWESLRAAASEQRDGSSIIELGCNETVLFMI